MAPLIPIAAALAREFLPELVGKVIGQKGGEVAQVVVDAATGVTRKPDPEAALAALRKSEPLAHEFRMALLSHAVVLDQLADADRANARERDMEVRKIAGGENTRANWMVFADVSGLVACVIGIVWIGYLQAQGNMSLSEVAAAALVTQLANVAAYFGLSLRDAHQFEFGSSRGSREKDTLMATAAKRE